MSSAAMAFSGMVSAASQAESLGAESQGAGAIVELLASTVATGALAASITGGIVSTVHYRVWVGECLGSEGQCQSTLVRMGLDTDVAPCRRCS